MSSGRRLSAMVPDWGLDHLSPEAVVAYVDNELADRPFDRATRHLTVCRECAAQVVAQGQARSALRAAAAPSLPSSLLSALRSIPEHADLPPPPNGLAITADGEIVSVLRALPDDPPPAGLAARPEAADLRRRLSGHRRGRLGAGVAVTGLALLALGAAAVPSDSPPSATPDPGVVGAVSADAQLHLPGAEAGNDPAVFRR